MSFECMAWISRPFGSWNDIGIQAMTPESLSWPNSIWSHPPLYTLRDLHDASHPPTDPSLCASRGFAAEAYVGGDAAGDGGLRGAGGGEAGDLDGSEEGVLTGRALFPGLRELSACGYVKS